jgi:hypothetical protein
MSEFAIYPLFILWTQGNYQYGTSSWLSLPAFGDNVSLGRRTKFRKLGQFIDPILRSHCDSVLGRHQLQDPRIFINSTSTRRTSVNQFPKWSQATSLTKRSSCIFYGDLYPNEECYNPKIAENLTLLIEARKKFAYGPCHDYFEDPNCIGFVRMGDLLHPGCAVLLSNKET